MTAASYVDRFAEREYHGVCRRCGRGFVGRSSNQRWCEPCEPVVRQARREQNRKSQRRRRARLSPSDALPAIRPRRPPIMEPKWPAILVEARRELEAVCPSRQ